jgi:hypothetical protein
LHEILSLGTKTGKFSIEFFREYIELSKKDEIHILVDYQQTMERNKQERKEGVRQKAKTNWNQYC